MFRRCAPIVLLPLLAAPLHAAVFGGDDRVHARRDQRLAPIGVVSGGIGVSYGSGFLIDHCTLLSARHVAGPVAEVVGRRLLFRAGRRSSEATVIAAGQYQDSRSPARTTATDWIVLRLDRCLGRSIGFLRLDAIGSATRISAAGFPRDRSRRDGVVVDRECRIVAVGRGEITHDCATLPGNSGGPLLKGKGGEISAIGINAAGWDRTGTPFVAHEANVAVALSSIATQICPFVAAAARQPLCLLEHGGSGLAATATFPISRR